MAMFRPLSRSLSTSFRYGGNFTLSFSFGVSAPLVLGSHQSLSFARLLSTVTPDDKETPSPPAPQYEDFSKLSHEHLFSATPDIIESGTPQYEDFSRMTNEELADTSTIPGWDLIHSPPRTYPRGALIGKVVSTRMQKTINVAVDRYRIVPKIRKRMRYTRKFFAHDENEVANMGDLVMITPCHRMSKHKHFMLREIIRPKGQL